MKELYYTPELEDLHIGYHCEWLDTRGDWIPMIVLNTQDIMDAFDNKIRTPYLTKEQIEREGFIFKKSDKFSSWYESPYHKIQTVDNGEYGMYIADKEFGRQDLVFRGIVKSINEFRKIIKMIT